MNNKTTAITLVILSVTSVTTANILNTNVTWQDVAIPFAISLVLVYLISKVVPFYKPFG